MNPICTILTTGLGLISMATAAPDTPATSAPSSILRKPLLTALLGGQKTIDRIEVKEINFVAHQQTGRHRHPGPVVGYIAEGSIFFQVEGQPATVLRAGKALPHRRQRHRCLITGRRDPLQGGTAGMAFAAADYHWPLRPRGRVFHER